MNLSVLKTLSHQCRDFKGFKQILSQVTITGFIKNKFGIKTFFKLSTDLSFVHVDYSLQIFNVIEKPHASLYNILLIAYVRRNYPHRAIHFYKLMLNRNVGPNVYTYPFLVEACAIRVSLSEGKQMHNHVLKLGFGSDVHVRSILVDMYADCWRRRDAFRVFDEGPMMDSFVCCSLLEAWQMSQEKAWYIYNLTPEKDRTASNIMIMIFVHSNMMEEAQALINEIPGNDTESWSELINLCWAQEAYEHAFYLFGRMHANGRTTIDELVVEAILSCFKPADYLEGRDFMVGKLGRLIHSLVVKIGIESDVEVQEGLIRMYSELGEILSARNLFYEGGWLHHRSWASLFSGYRKCGLDKNVQALFESMPKDLLFWKEMMSYYSERNCFSECLALFQEMLRSGITLDIQALRCVIMDLPCHFAALDLGKCIHAYLIKEGYNLDTYTYRGLGGPLSRMYRGCGGEGADSYY